MDKEKLQDKLKSLKGKEYLDKIKKSVDAKELLEKAKSVDAKELLEKAKSIDAKEYLDKIKSVDGKEILDKIKSVDAKELLDKAKSVDAKELLEKAKSIDAKEYLDKIKSVDAKELLEKAKSVDAKELLEKAKSVDGKELLGKAKSLKKSKKKMILIAALCCLCVVGGVRWLMKSEPEPHSEAGRKEIPSTGLAPIGEKSGELGSSAEGMNSHMTGEILKRSAVPIKKSKLDEAIEKIFETKYFKGLADEQKSAAYRKILSSLTMCDIVEKYNSWFGDKDTIAKTVYNFLDEPGSTTIHIVPEFSKEDEMLLLKVSSAYSKNFDELFSHPKYKIPVQSEEYKVGKTLDTWNELDKEKRKKEEARKRKLFEEGAEKGDPWCLYGLSNLYAFGEGGLKGDDARAVELMSKAAELNVPDANRDLGCYYLDGWWGLEKDNKKGLEFTTKAAELEDPKSLNLLGVYYLNGRYDLPQDIQRGLVLITKAADLGDPNACANLGGLYEEGKHVEQDIQIAQAYYKKLKMLGERPTKYKSENEFWVKRANEHLHGLQHLPDLYVDPEQLIRDYEENEKAADSKYKGKTVRMKGYFKLVDKKFRDKYATLSVSEEQGPYVQCRFDKDRMRQLDKMFKGSSYDNTVQGVVAGKSWGDIQVEHCWFLGE